MEGSPPWDLKQRVSFKVKCAPWDLGLKAKPKSRKGSGLKFHSAGKEGTMISAGRLSQREKEGTGRICGLFAYCNHKEGKRASCVVPVYPSP